MLRPVDPVTFETKKFEDYTTEEAESALTQFHDIYLQKIAKKEGIEPKFASEYVILANKTAKADSIPDDIQALAGKYQAKSKKTAAPEAASTTDTK